MIVEMARSRELAGVRIVIASVAGFAGIWRTLKIASSAVSAGAEVTVIGYERHIPEVFSEYGLEVLSVPGLRYSASKSPLRVLRVAANVLLHHPRNVWVEKTSQSLFAEVATSISPDIVHAVDLSSLEICARIADASGARLVFDSAEYWQGFVDNPDMDLPADRRVELLDSERRNIVKCDAVFSTSDEMGARLVDDYDISPPTTIHNAPPDRVRVATGSSRPLRLVFHGGLSRDRNLDGLIQAVKILEGHVTLDIHGFSRTHDVDDVLALIEELALQGSVTVHGPFSYPDVVGMLATYDVGVLTHQMVDENFRYTLPNKVFDCMCAGLAVAMSDSPPMRSLVDREGFGIVLDPSTPETIAAGLKTLVDDSARVSRMKQAAVEASERYWWPVQGENVVSAYLKVIRRDSDDSQARSFE